MAPKTLNGAPNLKEKTRHDWTFKLVLKIPMNNINIQNSILLSYLLFLFVLGLLLRRLVLSLLLRLSLLSLLRIVPLLGERPLGFLLREVLLEASRPELVRRGAVGLVDVQVADRLARLITALAIQLKALHKLREEVLDLLL